MSRAPSTGSARPIKATAWSLPTLAAPSSSAVRLSGAHWQRVTRREPASSSNTPPPLRPPPPTRSASCGPTGDSNRSPATSRSLRRKATASYCSAPPHLRSEPPAALGLSPALTGLLKSRVQGDGRIDQRKVCEGLREIPQLSACQVDLF